MKKSFKRLISMFLAVSMMFGVAPLTLTGPQLSAAGETPDITGHSLNYSSGMTLIDPNFLVSYSGTITGGKIYIDQGFNSGSGDYLYYTNTGGVTGSYSSSTGILTLSGSTTAANYQSFIRNVSFRTNSISGTRSIVVSLNSSSGNILFYSGTGHYYEYVAAAGLSWTNAKNAAAARTYLGMAGYLTTITSAGENAFVAAKSVGDGWMGASDEGHSKEWYWVTGPENGTKFCTQNSSTGGVASTVPGCYQNFESGEPNDASGVAGLGENYLHMYSATGKWNDYAYNNPNILGYLVEYGTTAMSASGSVASIAVNIVSDVTAPTISSITQSPSAWTNGSVVVTVAASDASGIAALGYSFDGGSTWQVSNTKTYSVNSVVSANMIKVKDTFNNITSYASSVSITNIDLSLPVVNAVTPSTAAWTNGSVILTISASDVGSGVKDYSFDNGSNWQSSNTNTYSANTVITSNTIRVRDNVGNVGSYASSVTIGNIDTTTPSISSVTPNTSAWRGDNVTLTVSASDTGSNIQAYSFDGGSNWQAGNSKTYTENTTVIANKIKVKDNAGNIASYASDTIINNIDKTSPTILGISFSPTDFTNGNVTVTVNANDLGCGVKEFSFDGGVNWQAANTYSFTSNTTIAANTIRVKDTVDNIANYSAPLIISNIDKSFPSISSVTPSTTIWTNGDVSLTVSASDIGSGIKEYSFNSGISWQTSNVFTYSSNTVIDANTIRVKDNVGNVTMYASSVTISNIDTTEPSINSVTPNTTDWTSGNITLTVSASDSGSNIKSYSFDGGLTWQAENSLIYLYNTVIAANSIKVIDNAGNIKSYAFDININNIDKTSPTIMDISFSTTDFTRDDVTVTVNATDFFGCGVKEYSFDGGIHWQASNTNTYTSNTIIESTSIRVKDKVGNNANYCAELTINNIDKNAPVISDVTGNTTSWTLNDVTLKINAVDTGCGIKEYSFDGGAHWQSENTKAYSANTVIAADTIKVKDYLGNISSFATPITIDKIDKTGPDAPIISNDISKFTADYWYNTLTTFHAEVASKTGCPEKIQVKASGLFDWITFNDVIGLCLMNEGSYIISMRSIDELNRTSDVISFIVQYDKTLPVVDGITFDKINDSDFMRMMNHITFGHFFKEGFKVTVNASDAISGVKSITYNIDGNDITVPTTNGSISFTVDSEFKGIVKAKTTDKASNTNSSWYESTGVINESNNPVITVDTDTSDWRNADFNISASIADSDAGINKIAVKVGSGADSAVFEAQSGETLTTSKNISIPIKSEGSYTVVITAEDNSGNISVKTVNVKLDKSAPTATVTGNPSDWTADDVTISINASDTYSGIIEYSFDSGVTWQTGSKKTYTGNTTILANTIRIKDNANNILNYGTQIVVDKIDKDAPVISGITGNAQDWTLGDVTISVDASDASCGIKEYSFDGGAHWQAENTITYTSNIVIAEDTIKVKDNLGNTSSYKAPISINKIDKSGPSDPSITNADKFGTDNWYNSSQAIAATFTVQAGCPERLQYSLDNGNWTNSDEITVGDAGTHTVVFRTIDYLNRTSAEQLVTVQIDRTAPTIQSITYDKINIDSFARVMNFVTFGQFFKEGFKVTIAAGDVYGVVKSITYNTGDSDVTASTVNSIISFNINTTFKGTIKAKATDKAGNTSSDWLVSGGVVNEPDAPVITVNTDTTDWKTQDFSILASIADSDAGINKIAIKVGSDKEEMVFEAQAGETLTDTKNITIPITAEGNYPVVITTEDNSGNISAVTIMVKLDKTKPVINILGNPANWIDTDVTLTIDSQADTSGVKEYSFDNGATWQNANNSTFAENQTVKILARDNAGLISNISTVVINRIDKNYPEVKDLSTTFLVNATSIKATSTKNGKLYIVPKATTTYTTQQQLAAASANARNVDCTANVSAEIKTSDLVGGKYQIYAVDILGHVSQPASLEITYPITSTSPGAITSSAPSSSAASSAASSSAVSSNKASSSGTSSNANQIVTYVEENKELKVAVSGLEQSVKIPEASNPDVTKISVELVVGKVEETKKPNYVIMAEESLSKTDQEVLAAFDLSLVKKIYTGDNVETKKINNSDISGWITVRLPLPAAYESRKDLQIVYIDDNGNVTKYETKVVTIDGKNYLEFKTNHFSTYAIVAKSSGLPTVPNTGNPNYALIFILIFALFATGSGVSFIKYRALKKI